jgi:thioester reductase-like protein
LVAPRKSTKLTSARILTGATGSLGAHILSQLVVKYNVEAIYCLVRASSLLVATDRVMNALSSKFLTPTFKCKVICLPADLSRSDLGLGIELVETLRNKLTKVIHCAWAVNFNLGVSSFEGQHIRGVYNLISLCLSVSTPKPAEFYFCSSVSAAAGAPLPATISETYIENLSHAQSMGYARSKLVAENIVKAAVEKTGIHAKVLRVGQIIGDSRTGLWNSTESIPLMIRSAVTLGALPELDEVSSDL